jgi:hypothetical protein
MIRFSLMQRPAGLSEPGPANVGSWLVAAAVSGSYQTKRFEGGPGACCADISL